MNKEILDELHKFNELCRLEKVLLFVDVVELESFAGQVATCFRFRASPEATNSFFELYIDGVEGARAILRHHYGRLRDLPKADAPRAVHKSYAGRYGYFWVHCPRCGREFGGHEESRGVVAYSYNGFGGFMTCCENPLYGETDETKERVAAILKERGEW